MISLIKKKTLEYAELRSDVKCKPKKIPVIICKIIVIPKKKPRFQKEFIWRGQGYDCKWDFISNTKLNFNNKYFLQANN